ncbi:MAG TPA: ABC transporter ATP-binding protein [Clostridiales bacterium]|nr:MAG: ABC transporter ATP-binding protein [Clostridiales bacterium GWD2_32_19]HCC07941.1 ABC transporter ATP-binding protein [Clostridiales bacterium]
MLAIETKNLQKYYGVNKILSDVSFQINEKEKVGFVGQNGCGKTTLFKMITGIEDYKDGNLIIKKGLTVGYLDQIPNYDENYKVIDVLNMAFLYVHKLNKQMKQIEHEMSVLKDKELEIAIKKYADIQNNFEAKDGYKTEESIARVCNGLGFDEVFINKNFHTLSGGEKTKVILAKILLEAPDILLLDEPTNHLDIEAVEWLEDFMKEYRGTVLIISHDRYFLDRVIEKVIEVDQGKADTYYGNYTYYTEEKERRLLAQITMYTNQQKEIGQMEDAVHRFKDWGARTGGDAMFKKMRNMEKRIERMDKTEKPMLVQKKMKLVLNEATRTGNEVLEIKDYGKSFYDKQLFKNANLKLMYLDSAVIIGGNGCGKSTIVKSILNEYIEKLDDTKRRDFPYIQDLDLYKKDFGTIKLGSNIKLAYLDQSINFACEEHTVLEEFRENIYIGEKEARNTLAKFLFCGDDVFKKVKSLSGGEKTRLRLGQLIQQDINFLVLDEPTNHLDIDSKQVLEETLTEFEGTIFFISHDRYFINKIANKIFEVKDKEINCYNGNYDYYKVEKAKLKKIEPLQVSKNQKEQKDKKSYNAAIEERTKATKKQTLEVKIYGLEKQIEDIDKEAHKDGNEYEKVKELFELKEKIKIQLDDLMLEWLNY